MNIFGVGTWSVPQEMVGMFQGERGATGNPSDEDVEWWARKQMKDENAVSGPLRIILRSKHREPGDRSVNYWEDTIVFQDGTWPPVTGLILNRSKDMVIHASAASQTATQPRMRVGQKVTRRWKGSLLGLGGACGWKPRPGKEKR